MDRIVIAIIEDEADLLEVLSSICRDQGYECYSFRTAEDFMTQFAEIKPDLVITDRNLPGLGGGAIIEFTKSSDEKTPVLMISGSDSDENIIEALKAGADDFISKPFHPDVLFLKISKLVSSEPQKLKLNYENRSVETTGRSVQLTQIEFEILEKLSNNYSTCVGRDVLLADNDHRSLDVHINRLRKKLVPIKFVIETVRGRGYRILKQNSNSKNPALEHR